MKSVVVGLIQNDLGKRIAGVLIILFLFSFSIFAQNQLLSYNVVYKGNIIGDMQVSQNKSDGKVNLKMVSNVQMHLLFGIKMSSQEESSFENGKLIYSSVYRQVNGKEKANKQTRAVGNNYQTSSEGIVDRLSDGAIEYNIHSLYFHEPVNLQKVYSDNYQQLLPIKKINEHSYKIHLPDGNCNYYFYKNGICNRVNVNTSMVSVEMLLKQ
jgi:hypothetical protein